MTLCEKLCKSSGRRLTRMITETITTANLIEVKQPDKMQIIQELKKYKLRS